MNSNMCWGVGLPSSEKLAIPPGANSSLLLINTLPNTLLIALPNALPNTLARKYTPNYTL